MTSAGEVFVIQLGRASRHARRFVRDLPRADREDIIASALLWCWENRANYSLTTSLETWFVGAVRNAYRDWAKGELRNGSEQLAAIPTSDTTQRGAEVAEAAETLIRALPDEYKKVARFEMAGLSRVEMMEKGLSHDAIYGARQRIRHLRRLLPDDLEYRRAMRTSPAQDHYEGDTAESGIDQEIAKLDFPPPRGHDCPPCWRCKWFDGFLPGEYKPTRMTVQEPEVRDAVRDTEARKIEIANEVRDGDL